MIPTTTTHTFFERLLPLECWAFLVQHMHIKTGVPRIKLSKLVDSPMFTPRGVC